MLRNNLELIFFKDTFYTFSEKKIFKKIQAYDSGFFFNLKVLFHMTEAPL